MSFNAGEQVGPYRILEQLGQGGMATVYKAYHASLDRYVAIKVLHHAFLEDANFLARFQREARVVARLEHPNIVPIYDYAEHENRPYLVMKYIEGDTLKARLQRGPLSASEATFIIESVGAALAYAHKQGILHRDVKPSNVINANEGQIYLADFGLARIAQSGESTLTTDAVLGTPQYISPEQAIGKKDLDEGTDIYSFGAMIYEMTVGRVPFSADTPFSVIHDHIYTPLPLPSVVNPGISPALERFLLKALAKDRADRFVDVPEMVAAFKEAWASSASTLAFSTGIPAPAAGSASSAATASSPMTVPVQPQPLPPFAHPIPGGMPDMKRHGPDRRWWIIAAMIPLCLCCVIFFLVVRSSNRNESLPDLPPVEPTTEITLDDPAKTPDVEVSPIPQMSLADAKQLVDKNPKDPKAHLFYGYALIKDGQEASGYAEIKNGADLAGKNQQLMLIEAARSFEAKESWLAAAIIYVHIAETARVMPPARVDDMHRAVYMAFAQDIAPKVLDYGTIGNVDQPLSLVAQIRFNLNAGENLGLAESLLNELKKTQPNTSETKLLKGELLSDKYNTAEATKVLQDLIDSPNVSLWIKAEAQKILDDM